MRKKNITKSAYYFEFVRRVIDRYVIWKKIQKKYEPTFFDLPSHSIKYNRVIWNSYDWTTKGEEWTKDVTQFRGLNANEWKNALINENLMSI